MKSTGVPHIITSAFRPGSITAGGKMSHHSMGRAIDIAGPTPMSHPQMMAIWNAWQPVRNLLSGLFYSGAPNFRDSYGDHPIGMMDAADRKNHYDHVHVALAKGGILKSRPGGTIFKGAEAGLDEAVIPLPRTWKNPGGMGINFGGGQGGIAQGHKCEGSDTIIMVENFIGEEEWFKKMMKEYGIKTVPAKQRAKGTINRNISSYADNAKRYNV
jgi:hypothetical protein